MTDEDTQVAEPQRYASAGNWLRGERERQKLTLDHVAGQTRIPKRHLEAIEAGDFAGLPARTYAVGFARTYARTLGLDDKAVVELVRSELGADDPRERHGSGQSLEPGDPARVPSRGLVFYSLAAILLLLVGGFMFYRTYFAPGAGPGSILTAERQAAQEAQARARRAAAAQPSAAAAPAGGAVVFTALDDNVWIKFYDAAGNQLMQKQMAKGETYTVPADAQGPQAWTGRPEAFAITVGGKPVPKLSDAQQVVRDVPVSGEALLARAPAGGATPAAGATPTAGASPAPAGTAAAN